ncbi:hypothetical protein [Fusobacterium nucleatum]|uniref:hypothetical protein n=1 Tax=Fusobacterium nucleatum TaxID=851 RepID=UPI0021C4A584|nr:hypothetical protein [Fusobacterium nucleatum]
MDILDRMRENRKEEAEKAKLIAEAKELGCHLASISMDNEKKCLSKKSSKQNQR